MQVFLTVFERGNLTVRGFSVILFAYLRVKKNLELPGKLLFIVMKNADIHIKEKNCKIKKENSLLIKQRLVEQVSLLEV